MVAGLVVSIDGGLKLTAQTHPRRINYRESYDISNEHTAKGIEIAFREIRSFGGGRGARRGLQLPGFKRLAQRRAYIDSMATRSRRPSH
jgi:hypothetical protein